MAGIKSFKKIKGERREMEKRQGCISFDTLSETLLRKL